MDLISGKAFWRLKQGLLHTYPTLQENITCDVIIVGGGISASLIAHEIVSAGFSVAVIEKYDIGSGSTSGSTALIQYEIDYTLTELTKKLGAETAELAYLTSYQSLDKIKKIAQLIQHKPFQQKNSYYLASNKKDAEHLIKENEAREKLGFETSYLTEDEIKAKFSFVRPGALYSQIAAELDPYLFTHQLFEHNVRRGLKIFDRTEMKKFSCLEEGVEVLTTQGFVIKAKKLVLAQGYETAQYLPKGKASLHSTFALVTKPLENFDGWSERSLLWETARHYSYLRTTQDDRAIIGGLDENFYNPEKRDRYLEKKTEELSRVFHNFFPNIKFEIAYSWAGTFAETKDGLPYIGVLPSNSHCFFCCGFGGNGITYSMIAAEIIRGFLEGKPRTESKIYQLDR